jgi:hypothetical protein
MISLEDAFRNALCYYKIRTHHKLIIAEDLGKSWYFWAGPRTYKPVGGPMPILIAKETGKVIEIFEPLCPTSLSLQIDSAPKLEIPPEYYEP